MKVRLRKTLVWAAATVFSIYLFYFLIPIDLLQMFTTFFALVGCVVIMICSVAFLICFMSLFDEIDEDGKVKETSGSGVLIFAVIMFSIFGHGALIIYTETTRVQNELDEYGVVVMAKIVDGSSVSAGNADFTSVNVAFTGVDGGNHNIKVDVSQYEFKNLYLDQELPIVYSPRYIGINRLIHTEEEFLRYRRKK